MSGQKLHRLKLFSVLEIAIRTLLLSQLKTLKAKAVLKGFVKIKDRFRWIDFVKER
ncbi:MAG TPA: hypothetical protein VK892_23420 [Pyrinomonadaceae bacterium]|nr:hypothetical protein [Pyrinomonadaceae bacterium]